LDNFILQFPGIRVKVKCRLFERVRLVLFGLIIGAASGAVQFWMLSRFTKSVTGGALNTKAALLGVCQFLLPLLVLAGCALLFADGLLWAGVGMIGVIVSCALVQFLRSRKPQ